MKNKKELLSLILGIMTFVLLVLIFLNVKAQPSYLELRKEYREYCNQITIDTITQSGTVKYEIVDGLKLIPKDTVWDKAYCNDYINDDRIPIIFSNNHHDLSLANLSNISIHADSLVWIDHSEPSTETFTTKITRKKYCKVKQERETQQGFWEWVNKNYLNE